MKKIKVIIKRPEESVGHVEYIENTLKELQRCVGGYIETVTTPAFTIICNEEGKIRRLPANFVIYRGYGDVIRGPVIICGVDGDSFADAPISLGQWEMALRLWGNSTE